MLDVPEVDVKFFAEQIEGHKIIGVYKDGSATPGFKRTYFIGDGKYARSVFNSAWLLSGRLYRDGSEGYELVDLVYNNGFNMSDTYDYRWEYLKEEMKASSCWCGKDKFGFANHLYSCPCWKPLNLKEDSV